MQSRNPPPEAIPSASHGFAELVEMKRKLTEPRKCDVCQTPLPERAHANRRFCADACKQRYARTRMRIARLRLNARLRESNTGASR